MTQAASKNPLSARWREGTAILVAVAVLTLLYYLSSGQLTLIPLAIGVLLLALLTKRWLLIPAAILVIALLAAATGFFSADQINVGQWIAANSEGISTVAAEPISGLAFNARRSIIQPDYADRTFFIEHAPDLVVLRSDQTQAVAWENFPTTYQQVYSSGDLSVYQRVVTFSPLRFDEMRTVDVLYNQYLPNRSDARLVGVTVFPAVRLGDLIRVALRWELHYQAVTPVTLRVSLVDGNGTILANVSDQYSDEVEGDLWKQDQFTTYHLLPLAIDAPFGTYNLRVGVMVGEGDLGEHTITTVSIVS
ncbi:MAG: hypothetical protein KF726_04820 [Anaerolineae bacterium]|nr:hypothetical protein [Anaerolineae bacterium]